MYFQMILRNQSIVCSGLHDFCLGKQQRLNRYHFSLELYIQILFSGVIVFMTNSSSPVFVFLTTPLIGLQLPQLRKRIYLFLSLYILL
jgi:hypothetical protein